MTKISIRNFSKSIFEPLVLGGDMDISTSSFLSDNIDIFHSFENITQRSFIHVRECYIIPVLSLFPFQDSLSSPLTHYGWASCSFKVHGKINIVANSRKKNPLHFKWTSQATVCESGLLWKQLFYGVSLNYSRWFLSKPPFSGHHRHILSSCYIDCYFCFITNLCLFSSSLLLLSDGICFT